MRKVQSTLTGKDVHDLSNTLLQDNLRLKDYSDSCTQALLFSVLLYAAARLTSIHRACQEMRGAPCDQTAYDALEETLPCRAQLQRRLNRALAATLPRRVLKGRRRATVALDIMLVPYYGEPDPDDDQVYVGQEKASTHRHHAYASVCLVHKGRRLTLAMMAVRHDTPWEDVVKALLRQARRLVPAIGLVLLDRGFYSAAVVRYLQRANCPFIMPVIARGRKARPGKPATGTRAFYGWSKSGWGRYTLTQRDGKAEASFDVAVKVRRKLPKRRGAKKKGGRVLVYACWKVGGHSVEWVRQTYRKRFGIETSHRQLNECRAVTTSRSPAYRLLLVGMALLLRNVWALLHLEALAQGRRGGRRVRLEVLRLAVMLDWLARHVEGLLRLRLEVPVQHAFRLEFGALIPLRL